MGRPTLLRKGRSLNQKTPEKAPIGCQRSGGALKRIHDYSVRTRLALQVADIT